MKATNRLNQETMILNCSEIWLEIHMWILSNEIMRELLSLRSGGGNFVIFTISRFKNLIPSFVRSLMINFDAEPRTVN